MDEDKQITEVTFEVTIRQYVGADDPNVTEGEIESVLDSGMVYNGSAWDIESIRAVRI